MEAIKSTFQDLEKLSSQGKEGMVFLGAGGDIQDWIKGIPEYLKRDSIASSDKIEDLFESAYVLTSTGGRTDLALVFAEKTQLSIGRLAIWRLQMGNCSWISDFVVNYKSHYNISIQPEQNDPEED